MKSRSTSLALHCISSCKSMLAALAAAGLGFAPSAHASFLPPEMMGTMATYVAWFVICRRPDRRDRAVLDGARAAGEDRAQAPPSAARRHPHLCLLSLAFGGLLWPLAWLWAYTKPVGYRIAYGTERHDDYYHELGEKAQAGELLEHDLAHLREELDALAAKGSLTPELKVLRRDLAAAMPAVAATVPPPPVAPNPPRRGRRLPVPAPRAEPPDGSHPSCDLRVLRLAHLHQVQVAAVEYRVAGHRRDHPDRRDGRVDPDAQRRRAVDGGRSRARSTSCR